MLPRGCRRGGSPGGRAEAAIATRAVVDRVWRTRSQLELAIVQYIDWFNHTRLHESLGDLPPAETEALYAHRSETNLSLKIKRGSQLTRSP